MKHFFCIVKFYDCCLALIFFFSLFEFTRFIPKVHDVHWSQWKTSFPPLVVIEATCLVKTDHFPCPCQTFHNNHKLFESCWKIVCLYNCSAEMLFGSPCFMKAKLVIIIISTMPQCWDLVTE